MTDNKKNEPTTQAENTSDFDPTGQQDLTKIKSVDLALHSDGIDHWQDEPQAGGKIQDKDRDPSK